MYFANSQGVLKYDGVRWFTFQTPAEALSLSYDSITQTIYVGCTNDFGLLKINSKGQTEYQSLVDNRKPNTNIGDVWDCFATPKGIFFNTANELYRYKDGNIKKWTSRTGFYKIFYSNNKLFVVEKETGLFCLENNQLLYIQGSEIFSKNRPCFIGNIKTDTSSYFLSTKDFNLYGFKLTKSKDGYGAKFDPLSTKTSSLFSDNFIYNGVVLKDNRIALTNINHGIFILDKEGRLLNQFTVQNGLVSDAINHIFEDIEGNLWLSTENGISLLMYTLPSYKLSEGKDITGFVESFAKLDNELYVGTSIGLFKFDTIENSFSKVNFPSAYIKKIIKIPGESALMVICSYGIYKLTSMGYSILNNAIANIWTGINSKRNNQLYFIGHDNGLAVFIYEGGMLKLVSQVPNINYSINLITEEDQGNLWLSTKYDGIIYLLSSNFDLSKKTNYINYITYGVESGLPNLNANRLYVFEQETIVATYDGIYKLDKSKISANPSIQELADLRFSKYTKINPFNTIPNIQVETLIPEGKNNLWLTALFPNGRRELGKIVWNNQKTSKWIAAPFKVIAKERINEIFPDSNYVWFGGTDIVYCFNKQKKYNFNKKFNSNINLILSNNDTIFNGIYYKTITSEARSFNVPALKQPDALIQSFPYQYNDFTFYFSANSFVANATVKFSFILEGEDKAWSEWTNDVSKSYMNLSEGKYIFLVKAQNIFGTESTISSYEFTVLPPWYRTILAYIIYSFLAAGFIYSTVVISTRSLNKIIKNQTAEIQFKKDEIEKKNNEIMDSLNYAKRIQDAIMPSNEYVKTMFPDSFVFFKPKDIVSGDFYWAHYRDNHAIIAAVDCTGHGVPGAFMSMMGNDYLNDIIVDSKENSTDRILNKMRTGIIKALKQRGESGEAKDGMDMSIVNLDINNNIIEYSGANNPIYIVREKNREEIYNAINFTIPESEFVLYEIKGNKFPVGIYMGDKLPPFSKNIVSLNKGDIFYIFSDGYADQFGGPFSKKLKYNQLKRFILESATLTMEDQKTYLEQKLMNWKGDLEQVDDILVIGVRLT